MTSMLTDPKRALAPTDDERELISACVAGDPRALERLYRTYVKAVERVIGRLLGATPDFEDLVQQTFIEALKTLDRFRGVASFKTWISRIAVHVVQHHLRAGKLRRTVPLELVSEDHLGDGHDDDDQALDEARVGPRLHALLDQLSPKKRIAFVLFVIDGRSVDEVAALMNASSTATRSRVFFARRELRQLIAEDPMLSSYAESILGGSSKGDRE
jgi:RNA polymerase sigma-70 factor (ECF subfamily)